MGFEHSRLASVPSVCAALEKLAASKELLGFSDFATT
jgi:hypothetical protein